jgi:hypothetical protein
MERLVLRQNGRAETLNNGSAVLSA